MILKRFSLENILSSLALETGTMNNNLIINSTLLQPLVLSATKILHHTRESSLYILLMRTSVPKDRKWITSSQLLYSIFILFPDDEVCVCVCVCVCVYVCVCVCAFVFTSIHRERFICLDQVGYQGTVQRCHVEAVKFICQVPSLLL